MVALASSAEFTFDISTDPRKCAENATQPAINCSFRDNRLLRLIELHLSDINQGNGVYKYEKLKWKF